MIKFMASKKTDIEHLLGKSVGVTLQIGKCIAKMTAKLQTTTRGYSVSLSEFDKISFTKDDIEEVLGREVYLKPTY
jgi:hypothetical protein